MTKFEMIVLALKVLINAKSVYLAIRERKRDKAFYRLARLILMFF